MKHVLITGLTKGLGRAMAESFAERGWRVSGCGRNEIALNALAESLGPDHTLRACDVADHAAVDTFAREIIAGPGTPDLLLNNAGIINLSAPLWEVEPEEFSEVIDINLKGVFHFCQCFIPEMIARGSGVIVNFSSGWGRSTAPDVAPYCGTKWAIEGLTRALAQELPEGVAAVPLNPGIIDTEMLRSCFGDDASSVPDAEAWADVAVPFLETLGPAHNGQPLSVPS